MSNFGGVNTGWRCPGCGHCYAPFVPSCSACPVQVATVTTTGGGAAETIRKLLEKQQRSPLEQFGIREG